MKRLLLCIAVSLYSLISFAQSPRTVILEHFTNASCPPCDFYNPRTNLYLDTTSLNVISLKYQVSFPGYDPMHDHNPTEVTARRQNYYGVTGVPNAIIDGNHFAGGPLGSNFDGIPGWDHNTFASRAATPSPFEISLSHQVSPNYDSIYVTMEITATAAVTGPVIAHMVVKEKAIIFDTPPGSTAETDYYDVLKKMLPDNNGTTLPNSWTVGQTQTISEAWAMQNVYSLPEIGVVAFIQNNSTKEILQAAESLPALTATYSYDALPVQSAASGEFGLDVLCGSTAAPVVKIENRGGQALTSLDINYQINGGTANVFNWTGSLGFFEAADVTLPGVSFTDMGTNTLDVWTSNPNGNTDEVPSNDQGTQTTFTLSTLGTSYNVFNFVLDVDRYGNETTWSFEELSTGNVLYSGGPYAQAGANGAFNVENTTFTVPSDGCYKFVINDSYGDGICCVYGDGGYTLSEVGGAVLATGGSFANDETTIFESIFACPTLTADVTTTFDDGSNNGSATVTGVPNGTAPFTYAWSTGATTANVTGLAAGTYTVSVSDANGCTGVVDVTIDACPTITANVTTTDDDGTANGTATVAGQGGIAPYTYSWSNGTTGGNQVGLSSGTYDVVVTDANGCSSTVTVEILLASSINNIASLDGLGVYPNPTTSNAIIDVRLNKAQDIRLTVFNSLGQAIQNIEDNKVTNAIYELNLSTKSAGVYLVKLTIDGQSTTRKVVLSK